MAIIGELNNTKESLDGIIIEYAKDEKSKKELIEIFSEKIHYENEKEGFIKKILDKIGISNKNEENYLKCYQKIEFAYEFARLKHLKQKRKDGSLYFGHPFQVANILIQEYEDINFETIVIGLIHDVWEDVLREYMTDEDSFIILKNNFGEDIAFAVGLMTKDSKISSGISKQQEKIFREKRDKRYFKKIKLYMKNFDKASKSLQKILLSIIRVKAADRVHNLREIKAVDKIFVKRKIDETKKYLLPLCKKRDLESYNILLSQINNIN